MSNVTPIRTLSEPGAPVSLATHHEVALFLYREARLLDEERYREWLAVVERDIHYWMPLRENRFRKDRRPEPTPETAASIFNDDYDDLEDRVKRFETGMVWSEDPAPRVCRVVTNVEVFTTEKPEELTALSIVTVHRSRRQDEEVAYTAKRRDRVRRVGADWKLARREVLVNHHVLLDENISLLF